jgi:hypothetical protein
MLIFCKLNDYEVTRHTNAEITQEGSMPDFTVDFTAVVDLNRTISTTK